MSLLYDATIGYAISRYVTMERVPKQIQVKTTSLDGTVYVQNIGEPEYDLSGDVYVDRDGKTALETAYTDGNLVRAELKHGTYYGRIIDIKMGNRLPGDMFRAAVTMAEEDTA